MNSGARRATIFLGVIMIIAIGSSAVLPLFTRNQSQVQPTPAPTDIPAPTFPPPVEDFAGIALDRDILDRTGLFVMAQPTGWEPLTPLINPADPTPATPEVNLNNGALTSIIQTVLQPASGVTTLDQVDAIYTQEFLRQSWNAYSSWRELKREQLDGRHIMDFELKNRRQQTFIARQVSWLDENWVYRLRVITPDNQPALLKYLVDNLPPTVRVNPALAGTPADWISYYDASTQAIIRFPTSWSITDSALGRPASLRGGDAEVRIDVQPGVSAADETAARAWVTAAQPGAEVTDVQPVTRGDVQGFAAAYTFTTPDGDGQSGLAVLLNAAEALYTANLRLNAADVNLNDEAGRAAYPDAARVMDTFTILTGVNIPVPTPTPTPTVLATNTLPPTATPVPPTATPIPPTATPVPPTATPIPPTATPIPPTATTVPPTATLIPPTATPIPPTAEATPETTPGM